jgi:hypothetical protein
MLIAPEQDCVNLVWIESLLSQLLRKRKPGRNRVENIEGVFYIVSGILRSILVQTAVSTTKMLAKFMNTYGTESHVPQHVSTARLVVDVEHP